MQIALPDDIGVTPTKLWRPLDPRPPLTFWWAHDFVAVIPGNDSLGINETLILNVPREDVFPVSYVIKGIVKLPQDIALERRGVFWLRTVSTP